MSRRDVSMLLALGAVWGASFMFIKVGVEELAPATLVLFRLLLGALTLAPIVLVRLGRRAATQELRANALPLAVAGILNSSIPFWTLSWAETRIDSGLAAVIQASAPLFAALLALRFSRRERVAGARLVGVVGGFGGGALAGAGDARAPAPRSTSTPSLVRAFALVSGASILGEPVTAAALVGLALVLAGVAVGTGATRLTRRREPEPAQG